MLTGITLENFKAFKEPQFIPIKPITLVFGQNNAGKSSIIHALAFLKHVHDTNGNCNPGRIIYGWSNLDLGSWKNLVFGQNENSSMMIKLHTETTTIQWRFENTPHEPKAVSFEIEEKIGEDWIPTAKGENVGPKGIMWQVKMYSSHSLWEQYKEALWDRLSIRDSEPDQHAIMGVKTVINETAIRKCAAQIREMFEKHFDLWLGDTWKSPPLGCAPAFADTSDIPFERLFPQQILPKRLKKTARNNPTLYDSGRINPHSLNSEKTFTDEVLDNLLESLHGGALTPEESQNLFSDLHAGGEIGPIENALHVEEILSSFVSHLHLDAQRFPPEGKLSKNRLNSDKPAHQPWLTLLVKNFDHYLYQFEEILEACRHALNISDEFAYEIQFAYENRKFIENWPRFKKELTNAGAEDYAIKILHQTGRMSRDLPPLWLANDSLRQIGIIYEIAVRKHVTMVYPPYLDRRVASGDPDDTTSDYELVFMGKSGVHTIHNVGSGVRVVVPVIVALTTAEVSLLSIEEPECHVHPKLQTELGDLIIQRFRWTYYDGSVDHYRQGTEPTFYDNLNALDRFNEKNRRRSYTLVETHSEHLILRILRRIRETTEKDFDDWPDALKEACPDGIKPDDVAVIYVEPGENGAKVIELPVTPDGDFSRPWPGGFFEERANEIF